MTHAGAAGPVERSIDAHISRIRQKIEPNLKDPVFIKTVRLGGYLLLRLWRKQSEKSPHGLYPYTDTRVGNIIGYSCFNDSICNRAIYLRPS